MSSYQVRWNDEDGSLCIQRFKDKPQALAWFKMLKSLVWAGEKLTHIKAPVRC